MADVQTSCARLRFGCFTLDLRRRTLAARGVPVDLGDKPFDLLVFLIARRQAPVTCDDILAHVWPGMIVDRSNVPVQISALRGVLKRAGDDGLIKTVPGSRYHFVGDVTEDALIVASPAIVPASLAEDSLVLPPTLRARRRLGSVAAGTAAVLALLSVSANVPSWFTHAPPMPRLSIVVRPFRNPGPDRNQDYLADAITDDLTSDLAHIPASTVIARESAEAARNEMPQKIGQDLHVRYIVSGTLYHDDAGYRVTVDLVDTATGEQLWNHQITATDDRLSSVREDIVRHIASKLHFQLDQLESTRSLHDRPTDPDALDLFFQARALMERNDGLASFDSARQKLEQAIQKQPDFADALAELGWVLLRKATTTDDSRENEDYVEAKHAIDLAVSLSPDNALALAGDAKRLQTDGHCEDAQQYARKAIDIEYSNLEAREVLARCAITDAHLEAAAQQYEAIISLDPSSVVNKTRFLPLAYVKLVQGKLGDAIRLLNRADREEPITNPYAGMNPDEQVQVALVAAYELNGDHARAVQIFKAYERKWPGRTVWRVRGYLARSWAAMLGVQIALHALVVAGMRMYADENDPGVSSTMACGDGDFAPTPTTIVGAQVISTIELKRLMQSGRHVVLIDVGRGAAVIDGAEWWNPAGTTLSAEEFAVQIVRNVRDKNLGLPVVIAGDGPRGCNSYNAARALVDIGSANILWYRGGEESWAAATFASSDRRPY